MHRMRTFGDEEKPSCVARPCQELNLAGLSQRLRPGHRPMSHSEIQVYGRLFVACPSK